MRFRHHLLDLIDRSGLSDRKISLLATGSTNAVREIRRGVSPRLDTLEALCHALGVRLETVPLDEPGRTSDGDRVVARQPEWTRRLREEIRRDVVEILGQGDSGDHGSNRAESGLRRDNRARQAPRRFAP